MEESLSKHPKEGGREIKKSNSYIYVNPLDGTKKEYIEDENGNLKEKEQKTGSLEIPEDTPYAYTASDTEKIEYRFRNGKWKFRWMGRWGKEADEEAQKRITAAYFENLLNKKD